MTGRLGFLRQWRPAWVAVTVCALSGCMGGTGTDTENGVYVSAQVIDSSGDPVRNVELSVLDLGARADSLLNDPVWREESATLTTDHAGNAYFYLKKSGAYMAAGVRGDSVLFIDTLRVQDPAKTSGLGLGGPQFTIETPSRATGRVRLLSGLAIDSGFVLLRGTKITSPLDDSGAYDLGWLPQSVQKTVVTVTYTGRARAQRFVKVSAQGGLLTVHTTVGGACLEDSLSAVTAGQSRSGSLAKPFDVARLVARACAQRVGAQVTALEVNAAGTVLRTLGTYVIPGPDAPDVWQTPEADTAAVPLACVEPARNLTAGLTGRATLRLENRDIIVNDFKNGRGCLQ